MSKDLTRFYDFIEIDIDTVQKLFLNYSSKIRVNDIKDIPEGKSTTNYIVYTDNYTKKYILKIYPECDEKCSKEYASYKYAKPIIRVPDILHFDNSNQLYNKPYMIIEYIDSVSLKNFIIQNKQFHESISFEIGCNLGKLHQHSFNKKSLFNKNLSLDKDLPRYIYKFT